MINVSFTKQEANALMQLIDVAVKQIGLNVAPVAVTLAEKITEAAKAEEKPSETT